MRFVRRQTTRARCKTEPKKRVDGIALSTTFGDLITADRKILNVENESRSGHKKALIVQDDFTSWIQSHPTKSERNTGDRVVFTEISSSFTEAGNN